MDYQKWSLGFISLVFLLITSSSAELLIKQVLFFFCSFIYIYLNHISIDWRFTKSSFLRTKKRLRKNVRQKTFPNPLKKNLETRMNYSYKPINFSLNVELSSSSPIQILIEYLTFLILGILLVFDFC